MSHIVELKTDGTYNNTVLKLDGQQIFFKSLQINGDDVADLDILIGIHQSKVSRAQVRAELDNAPPSSTNAIGIRIPNEFDEYECEDD